MNRLPDIVVLDFCIWLSENVKRHKYDDTSLLDDLSVDRLTPYASDFLMERRHDMPPFRAIASGFLSSEELKSLEDNSHFVNDFASANQRNLERSIGDLPHKTQWEERIRYELEGAFHFYLVGCFRRDMEQCRGYDNIDPRHLADYTLYYLKSEENSKMSANIKIMIDAGRDIADEVNFLEWIGRRAGHLSVEKLPAEVMEELIAYYARDTGAGRDECEKLRRDYYQTGWSRIFDRIRRWVDFSHERTEQSLRDVLERYFYRRAEYNCIILPLADRRSCDEFTKLIRDHWRNLNDLSGDSLDIYYSETDIGKTGYDIAQRIRSLPANLMKEAPCIILWKDRIGEARAVSIDGLTADQIRRTIQTIVRQIEAGKDFDTIIKEAMITVDKQQELNNGVTNYHIEGDGNVIGSNNLLRQIINRGSNNKSEIIDAAPVDEKFRQELLNEIEEAVKAIEDIKSPDLDDGQKEALKSILKEAKAAEEENSEEKRSAVKKRFEDAKKFLGKGLPVLISALANLTKIAAYFGLSVV